MGFPKYARATVVQPSVTAGWWDEIREKAVGLGPSFERRQAASQIVLKEYDPSRYLLSHCSIMASVDTESPGAPLGVQMADGVQINRQYPDFYVSAGTTKYINNNHDCWERKLLLASYRSFIGAENYVEHIQIPALSKGKIIDAAARDIGDSIYVDILVATEKKHKPLIAAITSGQLSTLSMGAQVTFTICTKCGNVAEDELQLCHHIKYQKGQHFIDASGKRRKIAELCGHIDAPPGSVKFIEGSWVANPAFTGAVLRNILDPATAEMIDAMRRKVQVAFSVPTRVADPNVLQKAARLAPIGVGAKAIPSDHLAAFLYDHEPIATLHVAPPFSTKAEAEQKRQARQTQIAQPKVRRTAEQQPDMSFGQDDGAAAAEKDPENPLKKPVDDLYKAIVKQVSEKVRKDLDSTEESHTRKIINENQSNESLIKGAIQYPKWRKRASDLIQLVRKPSAARTLLAAWVLYEVGGWEAVAQARRFSGHEILALSRLVDRTLKKSSMAGEARVYRTVIAVSGTAPYSDVDSYLAACREVVGRELTESESVSLIEKGKLYSLGSLRKF